MSTHTRLTYHIIYATKYRRPIIRPAFQERLYEYVGGIIRGQNGCLVEIGGIEDHVHILANLAPTIAVADSIREIKANSSKWVNESDKTTTRFQWQKGYGAFTVSQSQVEKVRTYIANQRVHHHKKSFKEEYLEFLKRHRIEFDPKYVFEEEHHG